MDMQHTLTDLNNLINNTWHDHHAPVARVLAAMYITACSWVKSGTAHTAAPHAGAAWRARRFNQFTNSIEQPAMLSTSDLLNAATADNQSFRVKLAHSARLIYDVDTLVDWVDTCIDNIEIRAAYYTGYRLIDQPQPQPSAAGFSTSSNQLTVPSLLGASTMAHGTKETPWADVVSSSYKDFEQTDFVDGEHAWSRVIALCKDLVSYTYQQQMAAKISAKAPAKMNTNRTWVTKIVALSPGTFVNKWQKFLYHGAVELEDGLQTVSVLWSEFGDITVATPRVVEKALINATYTDRMFAGDIIEHVGLNLDQLTVKDTQ